MFEQEYYAYYSKKMPNSKENPSFKWKQKNNLFARGEFYESDKILQLTFGEPIPKRFEYKMTDCHTMPEMVVNERIKDVLENINIKNIQLLEAQIRSNADEDITYVYYWLVHILKKNHLKCVDMEKSEINLMNNDYSFGIHAYNKLIFNERMLKSIAKEERLILKVLGERTPLYVWHESVVEALKAVNPKGIVFHRIDHWNSQRILNPS